MNWLRDAELLDTVFAAFGAAVVWIFSRLDKRTSKTERAAVKTVEAWEAAAQRKDEQIAAWADRFAALEADYARAQGIIKQQDQRLERKDNRIAHLEKLCDTRGIRL